MRRLIKLFMFWLILSSLLYSTRFRAATIPSPRASMLVGGGAIREDADFRYEKIDFPGAIATTPAGINARGDIVGNFQDASAVTHGFMLRQGVFSTIDFPSASFTAARGVNAQGDIVGRILDPGGDEHGFLLRAGVLTQVDYPGASRTTARGINNAGDITGRHFDTAGAESGFILKHGEFQNIHVPGSCSTDVWMAEDNGRVLVGDLCTDADNGIHGYVRNKPGDFQIIDFPGAGAPCTALRWINERDDIVGVYANSPGECDSFQLHGFMLVEGRFTAIDFPGATYTQVLAVNDDGEIVGQYTNKKGDTHGFRAKPLEQP